MAISSGAGPHFAWLEVGGARFPIEHGSVEQKAERQTSTFSVQIPMYAPGALPTLASVGDNSKVQVMVSTRGVSGPLITGNIKKCSFDFIGTMITVDGQDDSSKLHETRSAEKLQNKTPPDVVKAGAGKAGLPVSVSGSLGQMVGKKLHQDWVKLTNGISVASLIHMVAQQDGARWWVDKGGTLQYKAIESGGGGTYTVNYSPPSASQPMRGDFIGMLITRNVHAGRPLDVQVNSWHPRKKQKFTGKANVGGIGNVLKYVFNIPTMDQAHADQYAKSRAKEIARQELEINVDLVGDPNIDVSQGLRLNGTGLFDMTYQIDTIKHRIGMEGHTMTITSKAAGEGRDSQLEGAPKEWWGADPNAPAADTPGGAARAAPSLPGGGL